MSLLHGEWELSYPGTTYTFGTAATPVWNLTTPDVGDSDLRVADVDRPRQDGRAFGVDFRGARTITFELGLRARSSEEARREAAKITKAWRADAIRSSPGAVAELRTNYDGRERLAYGRPRRFTVAYGDTTVNQYVGIVADFAMADDVFYSAEEHTVSPFDIVPSLQGGLTGSLVAPLSTTASSDRSQGFYVSSEMPVWPVIRIDGPIVNPEVTVGDNVTLTMRTTLLAGEYLEIDTRPWARHVLRNGTANVSGSLRGTRLSKASLTTGPYDIGLKGIDPTGTASVRLSWRETFPSL